MGYLPKLSTKLSNVTSTNFPADFMFGLTAKEVGSLRHSRSQIVTLKRGQNIKYLPYAFTEHGAIMAANVLNSPRAVQMSVGACPERSRTGRSRIPQDACSGTSATWLKNLR